MRNSANPLEPLDLCHPAPVRRSRRDTLRPRVHTLGAMGLFLIAGAGCGGGDEPPSTTESQELDVSGMAEVVVPTPDAPIVDMGVVEDMSEAVANRFVDFSDKLRRRDFAGAREWLVPNFAGDALAGLAEADVKELPLGARKTSYDVATAPVANRSGYLASIKELIGPWERVEWVTFKVKAAEFQTGIPAWGRVKFKVTVHGTGADGGPRAITAWSHGRVEQLAGNWMLTAYELDSLSIEERPATLFTDVASAAGVAHAGIRFGKPGNQSFAWNGAASGDVDGDGLWDVFVPSWPANFLYMGRTTEDGVLHFVDEAEARGVQKGPGSAGGTGPAFFDFDNDGDQDLALADVGAPGAGNPLTLWRNDGTGRFTEVGDEVGFSGYSDGYSLTVFDADGNGWLDVFVCNYGRVEVEPNNSWIQATNGTQNQLFLNDGGSFREAALERGLEDSGWTYAAAAADYDLDGDQDLYVANDYGVNQLWINDGAGHFAESGAELGISDLGNGMGTSWGDLDNDGVLDLYVSNMSSTAGNRILKRLASKDETWGDLMKMAAGNSIFLQSQGDGPAFERCASDMGGIGGSWAWAPALADLDLDGRLDIYCTSGFVTGDTAADT